MSSTKTTKGRGKESSQALVDRPFVGQWSEEGAATARQRLGVAIGPYVSDVDGADPVSVRAALSREPFGHLISDEAIEKLCRDGRGADLFLPVSDMAVWDRSGYLSVHSDPAND
jgi:hypothetical protein